MAPNVRVPMAEFRSILLPPVLIPIRACLSAVRPHYVQRSIVATRAAQCPTQCRALHLYKTARSQTLLGQHKIMLFENYHVTPPSESKHLVNLVRSATDRTPVATQITLQELYDKYVDDGQMLYLTNPTLRAQVENWERLQGENVAEEARDYAICKPYDMIKEGSKQIVLRPQKGKQLSQLKNIMIRLSSPTDYFRISLDRAWQFVKSGSPVEFRIRLRGSTAKKEKLERGDIERWRWMHNHWPHLRPDFILKAMPKGSRYLIEPVSDGYIVQFVISLEAERMPSMDLNKRLWKIKSGVDKSMRTGRQSQLPSIVRKRLQDQGIKSYSVHSGLTREQALSGYTKDKSVAKWGFNEGEEPVQLSPREKTVVQSWAARPNLIPTSANWKADEYLPSFDRVLDVAQRAKQSREVRHDERLGRKEGDPAEKDGAEPKDEIEHGTMRISTYPKHFRKRDLRGQPGGVVEEIVRAEALWKVRNPAQNMFKGAKRKAGSKAVMRDQSRWQARGSMR